MDPGNAVEIRGLRKSFRVRSDNDTGLFGRRETKTVLDGIDPDIRKGRPWGSSAATEPARARS